MGVDVKTRYIRVIFRRATNSGLSVKLDNIISPLTDFYNVAQCESIVTPHSS